MMMTKEQEKALRRATYSAYSGIAHDLGDCDPSDALESVVWTMQGELRKSDPICDLINFPLDASVREAIISEIKSITG